MYMNGSENEKLFEKLVPVSVKDVHTNQSRNTHLLFKMEWQEASAGSYSKKLSFALTDNDDPYFLYNLQLSQEDFESLKTKQELLVDFIKFPEHIISLIEKVLLEEKNPQPKFLLVFSRAANKPNESKIDIVETNQLKYLTYVSLTFYAAQDSIVRQYVITSFRNLKDDRRRLQNSLSSLERQSNERLADCQHAYDSKVQELESVRKEFDEQLKLKDSKHKRQLQEETDRIKREYKDRINRLEKEIKEKESNFHKEIQKLESSLQSLEHHNQKLQDMNSRNEETIRELKCNVNFHEDEVRRLNERVQSLELKCKSLQSEIRDKVSQICQQEETVDDLQQQLRSKGQHIANLNGKLESEERKKKSLEEQLHEMTFKYESSEIQRKTVEKEAEKFNNIIIELQKTIKGLEKEVKNKEQLVARYKKAVGEKQQEFLDVKKQISDLNLALESKKLEIKSLVDANSSLQQKLEEAKKNLHDKEIFTKYLQKELTDRCIVLPYVPPPELEESPSALAERQLSGIRSHSTSSLPVQNRATKSVRIETTSPVSRRNSSSPSHFQKTPGADSAYCTASLKSNQVTSKIIAGSHNVNYDPGNFDVDQEAVSAAFGDGNPFLKHSTAKKTTKTVNTNTTPKSVNTNTIPKSVNTNTPKHSTNTPKSNTNTLKPNTNTPKLVKSNTAKTSNKR